MKILIDENLPIRLKLLLEQNHEVHTVNEKKWNSFENGELLQLMQQHNFDFLVTADQNIPHQQNIKKYGISLIVIRGNDNRLETVEKLKDKILVALNSRNQLIQIVD